MRNDSVTSSSGIRDVARHAGVSTASVSRALNQPQTVSTATRAKVQAAISALGYIPDAAARALASRRTRTIGAIIPTVANAMHAAGIEALQQYLSQQDYLLLLATSGYDPQAEYRQAQNMVSRGVDALVLRGNNHTAALRQLLAARRIPYVNVGVYQPDQPDPCIGVNNEDATWRATNYLLDLGHTRIGMVAALSAHNDRASARVAGVRRALAGRGLTLPEAWYAEVRYQLDDACQAARVLLAREPRPTAILGGNDVLAYGVLLQAERCGLRVPRDLSVMGFDDLEWSRHLHPGLTTMHSPADETWTRAGEYLLRHLAGHTSLPHHEIAASLVVRESTAPPSVAV